MEVREALRRVQRGSKEHLRVSSRRPQAEGRRPKAAGRRPKAERRARAFGPSEKQPVSEKYSFQGRIYDPRDTHSHRGQGARSAGGLAGVRGGGLGGAAAAPTVAHGEPLAVSVSGEGPSFRRRVPNAMQAYNDCAVAQAQSAKAGESPES